MRRKILTSLGGPEMFATHCPHSASLGEIIPDLAFCCGFGGKLSLFFRIWGGHSYFFYLEIIDSVAIGAEIRSYRTSNFFNFPV